MFSFFKKRKNFQVPRVELELSGRSGELKYIEKERIANAFVEFSGAPEYDLLVHSESMEKWSDNTNIETDEHKVIMEAFTKWAHESNTSCQW